MIDWINGAPPAELAVELMAAFESAAGPALGLSDLTSWIFRGFPEQRGLIVAARPVREPITEAIQLLEHSELVYIRWIQDDEIRWSATRLGMATLADGKPALRQRIKDRTGS